VKAWKDDPVRAELLALYAEVDALLAPYSCDSSGECCDFANTGREPYPTPPELAEVELAMRAASISLPRSAHAGARKKSLPIADSRVCPLLSDGRCRIYASRPFGCRTYFCHRIAPEGAKLPRSELRRLSQAIADLAARHSPRDPGPRPLTRALK
jgi:Fe-S-cluster containining protein